MALNDDKNVTLDRFLSPNVIKTDKLFHFPIHEKPILMKIDNIYRDDLYCLNENNILSGKMISFYLKYIQCRILNKMERELIYIFDEKLFLLLFANYSEQIQAENPFSAYNEVEYLTKEVDIFQNNFIVIPSLGKHWFLSIICHPNKCKRIYDEYKDREKDLSVYFENEKNRPCILIFDSMDDCNKDSNLTILRKFLQLEWNERTKSKEGCYIFSKEIMFEDKVACPKQFNPNDSGIYLLLFAECFFTKQIKSYEIPIKGCQNWFTAEEANKKRSRISNIIQNLIDDYKTNEKRNNRLESKKLKNISNNSK